MKLYTLIFVLVATAIIVALAEPEPKPAKASSSRYRAAQIIEDDAKEAEDQEADDYEQAEKDEIPGGNSSSKKDDASSGRLFLKKFLLFRNMFGQSEKQTVIPIVITGGNDDELAEAPDQFTFTSTGTIPTADGTITLETDGENEEDADGRIKYYGRGSSNENNRDDSLQNVEDGAFVDQQTLDAALASGAEEYVVTDQEIKGTSDGKASRGPSRIKLRRRDAKRGGVVSVRVPAKYRNYFKNGQRVVVNNRRKQQVRRRVIRRGSNRKRVKKNKNKRRRIVAV